jgi:hypothetical protein
MRIDSHDFIRNDNEHNKLIYDIYIRREREEGEKRRFLLIISPVNNPPC